MNALNESIRAALNVLDLNCAGDASSVSSRPLLPRFPPETLTTSAVAGVLEEISKNNQNDLITRKACQEVTDEERYITKQVQLNT